jgi:hypothetical protein
VSAERISIVFINVPFSLPIILEGLVNCFSTAAMVENSILDASRQGQDETDMNPLLLVVRSLYCLHTDYIPRQIFQHKEIWRVGDQSVTWTTVCAPPP